jgi:hypothetical protein
MRSCHHQARASIGQDAESQNGLCERFSSDTPTVVGIDHGFSFPSEYFDKHRLARDWPAFLDYFQSHCPLDEKSSCVDFVREGFME